MKKEILYKYALNNNTIVHIDKAEKGLFYFCPECGKEFILKKSGKAGRGSKQPHFAHKEISPSCTNEGYIHKTFKILLIDILRFFIKENKNIVMRWVCKNCNYNNAVFLLKKAVSIKEECNLQICRPDIALIDEEGKIFAAIEIVVNHSPEERAIQYYKDNNIVLVQINLSSEEDLNKVIKKIMSPDSVDYCLNPECPSYKSYNINRKLYFKTEPCSNLLHPLKKFFIVITSAFGKQSSHDFTEEEIEIAKTSGVNLKIVNDKKTNKKIPIYTCKHCGLLKRRYGRRNDGTIRLI